MQRGYAAQSPDCISPLRDIPGEAHRLGAHEGRNEMIPVANRHAKKPQTFLVGIVLVLTVLVLPVSSNAGLRHEVACGSVMHHYRGAYGSRQYILASKITGFGVKCSVARKIARAFISRTHFARKNRHGERFVRNRWPKGAGRFSCSNERIGSDVRTVACRDGAETLSFGWYDSSPYH